MAVMFGAMAVMRRIDQEEPLVLLYTRILFASYVFITTLVYLFLHHRITSLRDTTHIKVPIPPKPPSLSEARAAASPDTTDQNTDTSKPNDSSPRGGTSESASDEEVVTVMEYDLRQLETSRKAWITNACLLAVIHYKMESVSPLIMSALMGLTRLFAEDPLFQLHIRRSPAVGRLSRPFPAPKNPFGDMLKDVIMKPEDQAAQQTAPGGSTANAPQPEEDLHDDGDEEPEDVAPPPSIEDLKDDHIKSDFDDDSVDDAKKTQ